MTLVRFRNSLLLLVIGLYLLLNYGLMQVRMPPTSGSGIPIGELVLLFSLMTINYKKLLARLSTVVFLSPFLIWWLFGIGRALIDTQEYGFWALRDANHVIESLFLIVGFAYAARPHMLGRFFNLLENVFMFSCIYALGLPFRESLQSLSPKVISSSGTAVPILFSYADFSNALLLAVVYFLLNPSHFLLFRHIHYSLVATLLLGFTVFMFQARTIYLQILAILVLFLFFRRSVVSKGVVIILVLLGFLAVMPMLGLRFKGRLEEMSLKFLINHVLAIGGVENEGVKGAAEGVHERLEWWRDLYERWTADPSTSLFGLGYGNPLVSFVNSQKVVVREPHNSYISIVARLGLVGTIVFVWMHSLLWHSWYLTYKAYRHRHWQKGENQLLVFMSYFILIYINCIGEDAFEKPYNTIPFYFFWGIVLRMKWQLSNHSP